MNHENHLLDLDPGTVQEYLAAAFGERVSVIGLAPLQSNSRGESTKGYGYGTPVRIDYVIRQGERRTAVLHTMSPGPFGHEDMSDRAQVLLWEHRAFNLLPRHTRSLDVGGFRADGKLVSLRQVREFFLLTEYGQGEGYNMDCERLKDTGTLTDLDLKRADALCAYLIEIHRLRGENPGLYTRRIRELVAHGECIMGLTDSYPSHPLIPETLLEEIEHRCIRWRWKLKPLSHRLRQVHGDFHPWNILFRSGADFELLDRSRGEWGDPADDVACLTLNYVFFSLQRSGRLEGCFETLFSRFWDRYLTGSQDLEILSVVAPFLAFRALVMASPLWYPDLAAEVRQKLLAFTLAVLATDRFDPAEVNAYCGI